MKIDQANIVVTGAASGIGLALSQHLKSAGANVIGVDKQATGSTLQHFVSDLSTPENIDQMLDLVYQSMPQVDCFVANAGFAYEEKLAHPDWHKTEVIFRVNAISPIYTCLSLMKRQSEPFTFVINASAMAFLPMPGYALYSATKSAIHGFAEAFRFDLPKHVHLAVVYPIATKTNFFHMEQVVPFPSQSADQVARAILNGIKKNKRRIYPSLIFRFFMILIRLFPLSGTLYQRFYQNKRKLLD